MFLDQRGMKLNKYKKFFFGIIWEFLIADYMSWNVLKRFIFIQKKERSLKSNTISAG